MTIEIKLDISRNGFELKTDFTIPAHGITAVFGPSGCGKTTLLRAIAGLEKSTRGVLKIAGQRWQDTDLFLPPHRRRLGYVFQEASLFAHLNVEKNLLFGFKRTPTSPSKLSFGQTIEFLGLAPLLARHANELSGGERQRVAIGRALLSDPQILLMDEPLAALDRYSKNDIMPYLEQLHDQLAIPVLYVSHDMNEVERLADRMVLMEKGKVQAIGTLETLLSDPDLPLSQMPDAASVLTGTLIARDIQYGLATLDVDGSQFFVPNIKADIGSRHRLRIAASDVALAHRRAPKGSSILNGPTARIMDTKPFGDYQKSVFLRLGENGDGANLLSRITRKSWDKLGLKTGDRVHALVKSVALTGRS
jgi:molybdate transport system ATP-binding protein